MSEYNLENLSPEERVELLKKKSSRKSARPMGNVYPQKIKELLANTDLRKPTFKEYEPPTYTRVNSKAMFKLNKCPICGNNMTKNLDRKFFLLRRKCFDCVIKDEHQIRLNGNWEQYEKWKTIENQLAYFKDVRDETEDYLRNGLKKKQEFVKEDGRIEKWSNPNYERDKIFIEDKFKELVKVIEELEIEIVELREKFNGSAT